MQNYLNLNRSEIHKSYIHSQPENAYKPIEPQVKILHSIPNLQP